MDIELVKGFRDILPPVSLKRQKIKEIIEKNFKLFGFLPIETPSIEYDEFAREDNEDDESVSDRFRLKDRGDRDLSLRYEFTFQLKRIFKENLNIKTPFRRYQIGSNFRDEPIRKNSSREFTQCDADIIGESDINADAECIALGDKICKDLNIKYVLKVNNRKLVNSIIEKIEINCKDQVCREIDKIDKIGEEEVKKNISKLIEKNKVDRLMFLLKKDITFFIKEKYNGAEEISNLIKLCKNYKIKVEFSPFLIRGLSYYTGTIFEAYVKEINGSVFAGGRYDNLVGKYVNRQIPAVGISFGRLLDYPNIIVENVKCILISINQDKKTINLMTNLRNNSISCFMINKMNKALDYASKSEIPYVIFIGKKEIKENKVKLRNMKTGQEKFYKTNKLIYFLKNDTFK